MRTVGLPRLVCIALACCVASGGTLALAADSPAPERLLAADSILYWRFDGWTPHRAAMGKTVFGEMMRGDFGKFLDYTQQLAAKSFAEDTFGQSLLAGKRPDELAKMQAAVKQIPLLWPAICNHGVALGIEPAGNVTVVLPQGKPLYAVAQLLGSQLSDPMVERRIKDRLVLISEPTEEPAPGVVITPTPNSPDAKKDDKKPDAAAKPAKPPDEPTRTIAWTEGDDLVIVVAAEPAEKIVGRVIERRQRNLLDSPIYQRLAGFKGYETLSQGYIDPQAFIALEAKLNDFDDLPKFVAGIGLGSVRQLYWHTGVEGRNQRYTVELLAPAERHGVLKMFSGGSEVFAGGWPGFVPPDANQVHAFNINLNGIYDEFRTTALATAQLLGDDDAKAAHAIDDAQREATKRLGIDIQRDLVNSLGPTMVVFSAPSEGPIFLGSGVAIQAIRPEKLRKVLDEIGKAAVAEADGPLKINHRDFHGTDLATIVYGTGNADDASLATPFTPSYAIRNGWLVLALNPQTVEGCILRSPDKPLDFFKSGVTDADLDRWTRPQFQSWHPSPLFREILGRQRDRRSPKFRLVSIGESDPRPAVKFVLSFLPLIGSYVANTKAGKFDNSMIPNTQSVVEPLYPNVWTITDDGETFRIDGYKSAPFPFDSSFFIVFLFGGELSGVGLF